MVFANAGDTTNTNITLTVREVDHDVPIAALASAEDSVEILELSGATHVLLLKQFFQTELPPALIGKTLQQSQIGARTGLIVLALQVGDRTITNLTPTTVLVENSQLAMLGTTEQRQAFMNAFQ